MLPQRADPQRPGPATPRNRPDPSQPEFLASSVKVSRQRQCRADGTVGFMIQPYASHRLHRRQAHWTCVLIVTGQLQHVYMLRSMLVARARFHIEWARDERLAIDLALQLSPELVLIDAKLNGDRAPLLRRHLARGHAHSTCITCQERGQPLLGASDSSALHWDELPMLLSDWKPKISPHLQPVAYGESA